MLNGPELFCFYDEQIQKADPGTELGRLVAYVERLAGRKLRKSEITVFYSLHKPIHERERRWMEGYFFNG